MSYFSSIEDGSLEGLGCSSQCNCGHCKSGVSGLGERYEREEEAEPPVLTVRRATLPRQSTPLKPARRPEFGLGYYSHPGVARFAAVPAVPRLQPRCYRLELTVPNTGAELEEAVRRWISTCVMSRTIGRTGVPVRRERELVDGNPSLRSIWDRILQYRKGQRVKILAAYNWGQFREESITFSTDALPPPPPPPSPAPTPARPPTQLPNLPTPRPYTGATMGPGPADTTPEAERVCFDISCEAFEYLRNNWGITPSEKTVRNAIKKEELFLRRTRFRSEYARILPQALIFQSIDNWGEEFQKATMSLNQQVDRMARERIFKLLFERDPTFSHGGRITVNDAVNSNYAR